MDNVLDLQKLIKEFYGFEMISFKKLSGYEDWNYLVECDNQDGTLRTKYILKVANELASQKPHLLEAIVEVLQVLSKTHISASKFVKPKTEILVPFVPSLQRRFVMYEYISGLALTADMFDKESFLKYCHDGAVFAGKLDATLSRIEHPPTALTISDFQTWDLQNLPRAKKFLHVVKDREIQAMCLQIIEKMEFLCCNMKPKVRRGVIHGDLSLENFIFEKNNGEYRIKEVIDFFDCCISYYIFELCFFIIDCMYSGAKMIHNCFYETIFNVVDAYHHNFPLHQEELDTVHLGLLGRCVILLVVGIHDMTQSTDTANHMDLDAKVVETILLKLWNGGKEMLAEHFKTLPRL